MHYDMTYFVSMSKFRLLSETLTLLFSRIFLFKLHPFAHTGNLETREAMVTNLVQNVVKTTSNLVEDSSSIRQSWSDLRPDELGRAITALLIGLEENAFLLAETVTTEKIIIKPTRNVCKYIL